MRCKKQGIVCQYVMTLMLLTSATFNSNADENRFLEETMREQVVNELKMNVKALFEMVKIPVRPLLVHVDRPTGDNQDSYLVPEQEQNQEKLN